jgi:hypothetical protein
MGWKEKISKTGTERWPYAIARSKEVTLWDTVGDNPIVILFIILLYCGAVPFATSWIVIHLLCFWRWSMMVLGTSWKMEVDLCHRQLHFLPTLSDVCWNQMNEDVGAPLKSTGNFAIFCDNFLHQPVWNNWLMGHKRLIPEPGTNNTTACWCYRERVCNMLAIWIHKNYNYSTFDKNLWFWHYSMRHYNEVRIVLQRVTTRCRRHSRPPRRCLLNSLQMTY